MHHPALAMLFAEIEQVGLRPEQQTAVSNIQSDLEKQSDTLKEPHAQLTSDLADGAAAGRLDKAKIEADSKKLAQAAESMTKSVQDAANRLHETLDAPQRKKLVDLVREKAERMQAHAMGPMHGPGADGHGVAPKNGAPGPRKESMDRAAPGDKTQPAPAAGGAQAAGAGPKDGHEHMMGMGHPGPGPDGMGHPDMHMGIDRLSDMLGLTQDQREKLRTKADSLMKSNMGAMKNMHATMQKRMKAISDAFASDKFDAKKVGIGEKHGDLMRNMVKARVDFVEMVLSVLTPEQRVKFADHIRQHCEVCEEGK